MILPFFVIPLTFLLIPNIKMDDDMLGEMEKDGDGGYTPKMSNLLADTDEQILADSMELATIKTDDHLAEKPSKTELVQDPELNNEEESVQEDDDANIYG